MKSPLFDKCVICSDEEIATVEFELLMDYQVL